jgi:hypothetical protein
VEPVTRGYDLVDGYRSLTRYAISWNTPYEGAVYTLLCYEAGAYRGAAMPVKTVWPGQAAQAVVGTMTVEGADHVTWRYDGLDEGTKVFLVVAMLPDGTYYASDSLEYSFDFAAVAETGS